MKKYISLSVNDNPEYLFYVPLVCWAWKHFGWTPIIFYYGEKTKFSELAFYRANQFYYLHPIDGIKGETITQVSRLYAACKVDDCDYVMTSDIDMLPLADYWKPDLNITVWGHDLTGFTHYPICYIGMTGAHWKAVMNLDTVNLNKLLSRDLSNLTQAKSADFKQHWFLDQDMITYKLNRYTFCEEAPIAHIHRGTYPNGHAKNRVDRGSWRLNHEGFIDCHMLRHIYDNDDHYAKTMELLKHVFPQEDFTWFEKYVEDFRKVYGIKKLIGAN